LAKNYFYLSIAEMLSKVITFAAIAYLARVVGPTAYGYFEFAAAALFCAGLIVDQGLGPYGAREIARAPAHAKALVQQIVTLRFVLALIAMVAVVAFAVALEHPPLVTQLLLIYALDLLWMPLLLQWVFQGYDQMRTVAVLNIVRQTLFAVVVFIGVHAASQIWLVAVAEGVGIVGAAAYGIYRAHRDFGLRLEFKINFSLRVLRESLPIGLSQIFWVVRMYGAILMLGLIAPASEVGYFGAAMRIFVALHAFIYLYFFNLLPSLARTWRQRDASFDHLMARSMWLVAWACLPIVVVWVMLAPAVMTAAYGSQFLAGGAVLAWLGLAFGAAWLDGHYRFGLIAAGQQNAEMLVQLGGALLAIALIPLLYARFALGGVGLALCVAECAVWGIAWGVARARLRVRGEFGLLLRPALGALLAGVVFWSMSNVGALERAAVVIFVVALFMLVVASDLRRLMRQVVSNPSRHVRERIAQWMRVHSV
jgi:O-antigen/teichoic acid export membrane protein